MLAPQLGLRILHRLAHKYGMGLYDPQRDLLVPAGQSIYDPAVFGCYDLATQMVVPRSDQPVPFNLDLVTQRAQRQRKQGGGRLETGRYKVVLPRLPHGRGICLDACTNNPMPYVVETVEARGYTYQPIDLLGLNEVRREDLTALSFADNSIAAIISCDTLEHIPDYPSAVREMLRVLEPGGVALVHMPVYYFDRAEGEPIRPGVDPYDHTRYFSAREMLATFESAGFAIMRAEFIFDYGALFATLLKPTYL